MVAQGYRYRHQLATQARAATDANSTSWQPQLCGLLQQTSEKTCAHSSPKSSHGEVCRATAAHVASESLRASAARAEANERFTQNLILAVEEVLEKHTISDEQAADAAVEGIGRFLDFASTAASRPNESSIKQLVCHCSPEISHSHLYQVPSLFECFEIIGCSSPQTVMLLGA